MKGGQPDNKFQSAMEIFLIDRICQRYGWTFSQFEQEFERHPQKFGWLFFVLEEEAENKTAQNAENNIANREAESMARKRRLGLK